MNKNNEDGFNRKELGILAAALSQLVTAGSGTPEEAELKRLQAKLNLHTQRSGERIESSRFYGLRIDQHYRDGNSVRPFLTRVVVDNETTTKQRMVWLGGITATTLAIAGVALWLKVRD